MKRWLESLYAWRRAIRFYGLLGLVSCGSNIMLAIRFGLPYWGGAVSAPIILYLMARRSNLRELFYRPLYRFHFYDDFPVFVRNNKCPWFQNTETRPARLAAAGVAICQRSGFEHHIEQYVDETLISVTHLDDAILIKMAI